ncbi:MAG: hypothetical protein ACI9QN_002531 [Arcticibacterium sp.]|jgi:hypothetical protein
MRLYDYKQRSAKILKTLLDVFLVLDQHMEKILAGVWLLAILLLVAILNLIILFRRIYDNNDFFSPQSDRLKIKGRQVFYQK